MNPDQLAKGGSEHANQRALFAWANMVHEYGFAGAWDMNCYSDKAYAESWYKGQGISCIWLLHAIPNGGKRDAKTGAMLKAEGVKRGVPDIHLPVACGNYIGLYIEAKKEKDSRSLDQHYWANELIKHGHCVELGVGWRNMANMIQKYILLGERTYR